IEGEGLAGRRAGRDDDVLAARRGVPGCALMSVELRDGNRLAHARLELIRQRRGSRLAGRLVAAVGKLLGALEQLDRERSHRHPSIVLTAFAAATALAVQLARNGPHPTLSGGH